MRSRTGCQTCRQRKLKCDETKPVCGHCKKGSRECKASEAVVFRHQQNASMNGAGEDDGNPKLGGFYAYKNTFNENNVWVEVPKNVTFFNVTNPYNMEDTPDPESQVASTLTPILRVPGGQAETLWHSFSYDQAPGLEALSAAAISSLQYTGMRPMSLGGTPAADAIHASPHSSNNLNFILNPTGPDGSLGLSSPAAHRHSPGATVEELPPPAIDPSLMSSTARIEQPFPVEDHETSFLLRHYSEVAGQWMDLFDLECYFAHQVPVQALSNPLLKHSACAYAAKQLSRVHGKKAIVEGMVGRQADMELQPHSESVDWAYIGAKYYDKAISLLMDEVSTTGGQEEPMTPLTNTVSTPRSDIQSPRSITRSMHSNKRRRLSRPATSSNSDETLAAAAILCVYEFLDNTNPAWAGHLSGTKSLFDAAEKEEMMPVQSPTSPGQLSQRITPSCGRKATFWNFARQDFLAAFINESQTRLSTEDVGLWRAAGLRLDEQGFVLPSNTEDSQYPERQTVMREDIISNALIWLMSKIVNFLSSGDSIDNIYPQDRTSPTGFLGVNQMMLLERWKELEKELDIWHRGLPDTFKPSARLPPLINDSSAQDAPRAVFSEIWYSIPMCASTMQSYHMARTLLLINRPHESTMRQTTISERLRSYRDIQLEIHRHVHEIVGIALGRPEGSVRIHQVQPLFVAGQCLQQTRERRIVLDLLRSVESDLGWATDYRVKQLLKEWGWSQEDT